MSRAQLTSTVEQNGGGVISPIAAGKNFLANGNFDWWQRGTSFTSSGYTADRWYASIGGTTTVSQETSVVPSGSTYSLKWTTGANASYAEMAQAFEAADVNAMAGKTITFSGLVRAQASFSGSIFIRIQTNTTANTQTGGAWTTAVTATVTPSSSGWTSYSATYAVPSGTAGLRVYIAVGAAQASGTGLYFAQQQLEVGSVATPFSRAGGTLQGELALCQRYYERRTSAVGYSNMGFSGYVQSSTSIVVGGAIAPKRTTPTIGYLNLAADSYGGASAVSGTPSNYSTAVSAGLVFTTSGKTAGQAVNLIDSGSNTGYIEFIAEL